MCSSDLTNIGIQSQYVTMPNISILKSGQNATFLLTIITNQDIQKEIRIKGFYHTNIGSSSDTYSFDITNSSSLPEINGCSQNLYVGDKIIFHNLNTFAVEIQKTNHQVISIINSGNNYTWNMLQAGGINYQVYRAGFPSNNICSINVMNTTGLINNPDYDAILNLKVINKYKQTQLNVTVPQSNYNISIFHTQQGFIKLINNGIEIAKDINLKGDWFTFSDNNFDISPGYTRIISYTIDIQNKIKNTSQTNKSYIKEVNITGNFPTLSEKFNLFLPYQQIVNSSTNSTSNFLQWIKEHYPELLKPKIVVQYVNNNSRDINITTTQEKLNGIASAIFSTQDYSENTFKRITEELNQINSTLSNYTKLNNLTNDAIFQLQNKEIGRAHV